MLIGFAAILTVSTLLLILYLNIGKCPQCGCQMHRLIDSRVWMCENWTCRYMRAKM
jgi:hypothetical protein